MTIDFGIQIEPQFGFDYHTIERIALEGEKQGFDSIWSSDHFFLDNKSEERNCLEAWTLIAALAAVTKRIKIGTLVTCNSYRYPSLLAKIAATIDMISNGRLIFGFGAGWKEIEYNAYGILFPSTNIRLHQMEEAIEIIKLLWTKPKVSYEGKYYTVKDAFSAPKPIQKPWPPIMIGGMGEKVLLKMVAKHADWCNFFPRPNTEHSLEVLQQHCKKVGRDFDEIRKTLFVVGVPIRVTNTEEEFNQFISETAKSYNRPIERIKENYTRDAPGAWGGVPEKIIERFNHFIEMGFDYFQVLFPGFQDNIIQDSKIFAEQIIKKL